MSSVGLPVSTPLLMLAPMEGLTNGGIRELILDLGGVDVVATEFIRITSPHQRIKPIHRHSQGLLQIQFMASEPEALAGVICTLKKRELIRDNDWIDINVGCPSRRVNASGAGAALLKEPNKLMRMISATREAHPDGRLSMKTRLGYDSSEDFSSLIETLAAAPLDLLTIHARTKRGCYDPGTLQLEPLQLAVESLPYPVIGNGDVFSLAEAARMLKTGVAGLMCGRGAMINPFLFRDLRDFFEHGELLIDDTERISGLASFTLRYLTYLKERECETRVGSRVGTFKEFATWFSRNPLIGKSFFQSIKRLTTLSEIETTARTFFEDPSTQGVLASR